MLTIDYKLLGLKEGESILDVGCGTGRHTWEASRKSGCRVYGLDLGKEDLVKARFTLLTMDRNSESHAEWGLLSGDALSLPFKDATFDRVICSEVLEHVKDDRMALSELVRVLKPKGKLAISVPSYITESLCWKLSLEYHSKPGGHVRIYRSKQMEELLNSASLTPFARRNRHGLHSLYWIMKCLFGINNEDAFLPRLYHNFLVWDLETRSKPVELIDGLMNVILPKSMVYYASRDGR